MAEAQQYYFLSLNLLYLTLTDVAQWVVHHPADHVPVGGVEEVTD